MENRDIYRPMNIGEYLLWTWLYPIIGVGFILSIVNLVRSNVNINLRNYSKACLVFQTIGILYIVIGGLFYE